MLSGLTLGSAVFWVKAGKQMEQWEQRMFSSASVRLAGEEIISDLSDSSSVRSRLYRHIVDPNVHMTRDAKDSIYVTREEFMRFYRDIKAEDYNAMRRLDVHIARQDEVNAEMLRIQRIIIGKIDLLQAQMQEK